MFSVLNVRFPSRLYKQILVKKINYKITKSLILSTRRIYDFTSISILLSSCLCELIYKEIMVIMLYYKTPKNSLTAFFDSFVFIDNPTFRNIINMNINAEILFYSLFSYYTQYSIEYSYAAHLDIII